MASGAGRLHVLVPGAAVLIHLKIGKIFFAHVIENIQLLCAKNSVQLRLFGIKKRS